MAEEDKNLGGRPTAYLPEYNKQAFKLALLGATDKEIADFFEVNVDTIYEWKKVHPKFSDALKKGKQEADIEIANSLYDRAKGFTITKQAPIKVKTYEEIGGEYRSVEKVEVVDFQEEIPPDTTSMIFWLKNRKSDVWRDKQETDTTIKATVDIKDFRNSLINDIETKENDGQTD